MHMVLWSCFRYCGHFLKENEKYQPAAVELVSSNSSCQSCLLLGLPLIRFISPFMSYFLPPPASRRSVLCVMVFWYSLIKLWDGPFSSTFAVSQSPQAAT